MYMIHLFSDGTSQIFDINLVMWGAWGGARKRQF